MNWGKVPQFLRRLRCFSQSTISHGNSKLRTSLFAVSVLVQELVVEFLKARLRLGHCEEAQR